MNWADVSGSLKRHGRALLDLALPPMCPICSERLRSIDEGICEDCRQRLRPPMGPLCPKCGMGESIMDKRCRGCLRPEVHFAMARQAATWDEPAPTMIHRLKYNGVAELAQPMALLVAQMLSREFRNQRFDVIVPVPLHRVRERERGYNQSALIARRLGAIMGWPVDEKAVARVRPTKSQTLLSRDDRLTNVSNAFQCLHAQGIEGKRVLLLDDVHTTGSTLNETARALVGAGATEVTAVAVARAGDSLAPGLK